MEVRKETAQTKNALRRDSVVWKRWFILSSCQKRLCARSTFYNKSKSSTRMENTLTHLHVPVPWSSWFQRKKSVDIYAWLSQIKKKTCRLKWCRCSSSQWQETALRKTSHRPCTTHGSHGVQNRVFSGGEDVQIGKSSGCLRLRWRPKVKKIASLSSSLTFKLIACRWSVSQ